MNIVLTCGDINGIGMEVLLKALMQCHVPHVKFSLIVNNQTLGEIVNALQIGSLQIDVLQCNQTSIAIIDCIQYAEYKPGIQTADSAKLAIESLTVGLQYAKEQKALHIAMNKPVIFLLHVLTNQAKLYKVK